MSLETTATQVAKLILEAFDCFNTSFKELTGRAKQRFEEKNWQGGREDSNERLDLYEKSLDLIAFHLNKILGESGEDLSTWIAAKRQFGSLVSARYDIDRAETFFNSVTRKMLSTVGINREVEFFYLHPKASTPENVKSMYRTYTKDKDAGCLVRNILEDFTFGVGYENIERDAEFIAQELDLCLWPLVGNDKPYSVDVAKAIFYRNKGAYIIGRIITESQVIPLIIPLVNGESGVYADTVLLSEPEASIVFSFAYSYFHVDVERYDALIEFLRSIIPHAQLAELYTSIGYNRHGKTEFYRDLHRFVHVSKEQFVIAPGLEGAVMIVFTLPHYDFVFKVIKDKPCFLRSRNQPPKAITKAQVKFQYNFISHRDRAGRMVDTQEFENLRFKKKRFCAELLNELALAAKDAVTITDDYVIIHHLYVQRKVIPLPMYFQCEKNCGAIRHVLIDFGYFLKDLAASGVFPCDLFNTWNYGVTHWGRVVLFDYDDVLPFERVSFRVKPKPRNEIEENEPEENWIVATEEDFFMDEIDLYSGIPEPLKGIFKSVHGDLYSLRFWDGLADRLKRGDIFDIIPYDRSKQFHNRQRVV